MVADYSATSQVLTFGATSVRGETVEVMIPIVNDELVELDETIILQGSESSVSATFQPSQTIVNILDNDGKLISVRSTIITSMVYWKYS